MEEIELLFMDFQEKLMTLNTQGIIKLEYEFGEPTAEKSLKKIAKFPKLFQKLYFSNGFEIFWESTQNEVTGYWNLIEIENLEAVKEDLIENCPNENKEFLKIFQPVFYHSPEIVFGFTSKEDDVLLWSYSENNFEKNELLFSPEEYVKLLMDCLSIENFSEFILRTEIPPELNLFLTMNTNLDIEKIKERIKNK